MNARRIALVSCALAGLVAARAGLFAGTGKEAAGPPAPGAKPPVPKPLVPPATDHDPRAHLAIPFGKKICASGCLPSKHPTPVLAEAAYRALLARYAVEPAEGGPALDELLYYGRQTRELALRHGTGPLDRERAALLARELARTHVVVEFRVVDERGTVRVRLPPTRVPLEIRYEYDMEVQDLQPVVTSGTVKRVGLKHLWQRL